MIEKLSYEQLSIRNEVLQEIVEATSYKSEQDYLNSLVMELAKCLKADYVLVGIPETDSNEFVKTLAFCGEGELLDNMRYELLGTPCADVYGDYKVCTISENVAEAFPDDSILKDLDIEGYVGAPLYSHDNGVIGIMACLFRRKLDGNGLEQSTLEILSNRVTTEIERINTLKDLQLANQDLLQSKTELINKNEELNLLNDRVTKLLKENRKQNIALKVAKEKAETNNRLKNEFLHNMSHEIRTPLNGIVGFTEFLREPELTKEQRLSYCNIINSSVEQFVRVVDDILEISILETKQVKLIEREVVLNHILLELFSVFDIKAKNNRTPLYIKKGLSNQQSKVMLDDSKLKKVLSNLLENALKFTFQGFVELGYNLIGDRVEIYVKDSGIGIEAENVESIFERFSQEEKELSQKFGGLGLGLSIAKENTELLGGHIELQSEKGKGSTFTVSIPYTPVLGNTEVKGMAVTGQKVDWVPVEKGSLLIVEDDEISFIYLQAMIDRIHPGLNIIHAKNGLEAVDLCKNHIDIQLVLMDAKMPIMNGYDATRLIKELNPKLPIVMQSAFSTPEEKERGFAVGCDDYIVKPIEKDAFTVIVNKYLQKP